MYTVYWIRKEKHTDILSEGYVGITNNFNRRMAEHNRKGSSILGKAITKYSWDSLIKQVVVEGIDQELAELCENMLRPCEMIGWNICIGGLQNVMIGDSNPMRRAEQKQRSSESQRGELNHSYGKKLSEAHKLKIKNNSKSFKGKIEATNVQTNEKFIFSGKTELIAFGFNANCVYCCLNPKQRQKEHKGFTFKRMKEI